MSSKKKFCKNCPLFDREKSECKVAILHNGQEFHMPVDPEDKCHLIEIGMEVEMVRWYEGKDINGRKIVKMEYPETFFREPKL